MAQRREGLDELPASCLSPCGPPNPAELYSEARRLALEELLAGGPDAFEAFLRRERLGRFLSREEVRAVLRAAEGPGRGGAAAGPEDSFGSSLDCSSGTYFPEQSDLEPPPLELGWPAFYRGAYRGATRVEAHFQPRGAGSGGPHGCKDALRQQLRAAREVSARLGPRRGGPSPGAPDSPPAPWLTGTWGKPQPAGTGAASEVQLPRATSRGAGGMGTRTTPSSAFQLKPETGLLIFLAGSQHRIPAPKSCVPQGRSPERSHSGQPRRALALSPATAPGPTL